MDFSVEKIETVDQAKAFFQAMDCNGFLMHRGYPERHKEYEQLNISKRLENEWRLEVFNKVIKEILRPEISKDRLWVKHRTLTEYAVSLRSKDSTQQILETTQFIIGKISNRDYLSIAETIIGRGNIHIERRNGLIFLAYDLGLKEVGDSFIEIARDLISTSKNASLETKRCNELLEKLNKVISALPTSNGIPPKHN